MLRMQRDQALLEMVFRSPTLDLLGKIVKGAPACGYFKFTRELPKHTDQSLRRVAGCFDCECFLQKCVVRISRCQRLLIMPLCQLEKRRLLGHIYHSQV